MVDLEYRIPYTLIVLRKRRPVRRFPFIYPFGSSSSNDMLRAILCTLLNINN